LFKDNEGAGRMTSIYDLDVPQLCDCVNFCREMIKKYPDNAEFWQKQKEFYKAVRFAKAYSIPPSKETLKKILPLE
jgi:hypothetical protein